jgi:hypothetical protein
VIGVAEAFRVHEPAVDDQADRGALDVGRFHDRGHFGLYDGGERRRRGRRLGRGGEAARECECREESHRRGDARRVTGDA